ncbi:cell adhesion molecule CEACAM19 [Marmota flaviventris]|uniref:cell adhesion molecule CEACAM19 n=1 Tax=Marmota flaviventris TaxID=93162 RepID=UPI003A891425
MAALEAAGTVAVVTASLLTVTLRHWGTVPMGTLSCFTKGLLLSACILALWPPHGSRAALHIQKIPEQPQKNQDLLLSLQGVPDSFQDFTWYRGAEAHGGTRLFTYIPGLQRPQRDGSALGQRDVVGFPNGSMLLRRAQPSDSGTYQVAVAINPAWTMRAKTEVRVAGECRKLSAAIPRHAGLLAATIIGCLSTGLLLAGSLAFLLVTRGCRGPRATASGKPELGPHADTGDNNVYEVMPSPVLLATPLSNTGPTSAALVSPILMAP